MLNDCPLCGLELAQFDWGIGCISYNQDNFRHYSIGIDFENQSIIDEWFLLNGKIKVIRKKNYTVFSFNENIVPIILSLNRSVSVNDFLKYLVLL